MSSVNKWAPDLGKRGEYVRQVADFRNKITGPTTKFITIPVSKKGEFIRKDSVFRNLIKADGSSGFAPERERYHLYVSLACPWANRVLILRKLKGLEDVLPYTAVDWILTEKGWSFTDKLPKCEREPLYDFQYLSELYKKANPEYSGRFTVPIIWDKKNETIVNNESSEIIRILNTEFNDFCRTDEQRKLDLYPESLRDKIDDLNSWIYPNLNNGVYRSGFAQSQEAYDEAVVQVFQSLDKLETILSRNRYLTGPQLTEADVRLFTTLIRFDKVYHQHFKCNKKRIIDYPSLWGYVRDMYQIPGVAETIDMEHITKHYQMSHRGINPHGIVCIGPEIDFLQPHDRDNM